MIYGGPAGDDSNRSRKAFAREGQMLKKHETFNRSLVHPHEDALLISVELERQDIKRVFFDTRAIINIIFEDCFNQMAIQKPLDRVITALHGFAGDSVMYLGSVDLIQTLGEGDLRISKPVNFLVV